MAKKAKAAPAAEGEAPAPKSKKNLIIGGVGAVVLFFAGGKVMGGGGETKTIIKIVNTTTTIPKGEVVTLDAITMNLADGHLLKVGIGFQLHYVKPGGGGGGHGAAPKEDTSDPTKGYAQALDVAIDELGKYSMKELSGEGRNAAKEALVERLHKVSHGTIEDVYFHQFVMQ
jgi:flagellar FliL protein